MPISSAVKSVCQLTVWSRCHFGSHRKASWHVWVCLFFFLFLKGIVHLKMKNHSLCLICSKPDPNRNLLSAEHNFFFCPYNKQGCDFQFALIFILIFTFSDLLSDPLELCVCEEQIAAFVNKRKVLRSPSGFPPKWLLFYV